MKAFLRVILKPLSFAPAVLVMVMIFHFSSQPGTRSADLSMKVSKHVISGTQRILGIEFTPQQMQKAVSRIHHIVRKLAHVTEYFILAVSVAFPLYVYGIRGIPLLLTAGAFCMGYAGLDEYHQSFVAGRGASVRDVAIDGIGIFFGIILVRMVGWTGRMTIFKPLSRRREHDNDE